ncbi:TetR/AcrR family transcriptional regulator [Prauserella cavernicola]|uniref:TetR/AcrR family transcriptional regulator n=1 Tax=Prauserella cavernicola TaxID=2800127 RepID=A0A934QTF3_9PSEU|nr:TetR/AcrR family transcriptional regulator [Prauserella cavernicola]MBK1787927.1 TetR/AcrR family transcriptional regulator [Prauserella cavernicola]
MLDAVAGRDRVAIRDQLGLTWVTSGRYRTVRLGLEVSVRDPVGAAVLRPEKTASITEAVLAELAEVGYARLSMEAVARRAGVGKSALYRRWPGKDAMAAAAIAELSVPAAPQPDTGSLRGDIRVIVEGMVAWLSHPQFSRILPDVVAEGVREPSLAAAVRDNVSTPRRDAVKVVLDRAAARGELGVSAELALDLLGAAVYWRMSVRKADCGAEYLDELTEALVRAIGT